MFLQKKLAQYRSALVLASMLGFFFIVRLLNPATLGQYPLCSIQLLLHISCPGCGLTRAFVAMSHGHLLDALRWNSLVFPLSILFGIHFLNHALKLFGLTFFWVTIQGRQWQSVLMLVLVFLQWMDNLWHPLA